MPVSNKAGEVAEERTVEVGNTPNNSKKKRGKPYSPKRTLNLKMKERTGISPEVFCIVLAAIMAVALIIEYFGVYKRYEDLSAREAQLQEMLDKKNQTQKDIEDLPALREWFSQYSYEGFDDTMVDKIVVLNMLEDLIFKVYPKISIRSLSLSTNEISFSVLGLNEGEKEALYTSLSNYALIDDVTMSTISVEDGIATVSVRIVLKRQGGDENV